MLKEADAVQYLVAKGLLGAESIVDADLRVRDASRRHHDLSIVNDRGPSYLIKEGLHDGTPGTVAHEAEVYRWLWSRPHDPLARQVPRFHLYDEARRILVLELLPQALNLRDDLAQSSRFPLNIARATGKVLAALHDPKRLASARDHGLALHQAPPWIFSIHQPGISLFREASSANCRLVSIVQDHGELCEALEQLRKNWTPRTLIHADFRWDNWLIERRPGSRRHRMALVDWELLSLGDPAWDLGSAIAEYLFAWINSIPITGEDPPDRYLELTRYPLRAMRPAIRELWCSYRQPRLDAEEAPVFLLRAVRHAAARLLQTAYEQLQSSPRFTGNIVCVVQLTLNILQRTEEATTLLLGLPLNDSA